MSQPSTPEAPSTTEATTSPINRRGVELDTRALHRLFAAVDHGAGHKRRLQIYAEESINLRTAQKVLKRRSELEARHAGKLRPVKPVCVVRASCMESQVSGWFGS